MRVRSRAARLATAAVLTALATTAAATPPALGATGPASTRSAAAEAATYELRLVTSRFTTDFGRRTVTLTGTLTRPDGTPAAGAPVTLGQNVLYTTWNPWGDPIDPTERENRSLGTVVTDADGRFTLPGVQADRWDNQNSLFLNPRHEVEFYASYDPAEDPSDHDLVFARAVVAVKPVFSTITYSVDKSSVRAGDTLTVTGKVAWPGGHGPVAGTRVLLRTYYESEYNAQTTTDANGNYKVRVRIRGYDNQFVIFSAPEDYYIARATKPLPVKNVTR